MKQVESTLMTARSLAYKKRLLERWDYVCIVCGRGFENFACVTKEHIVPKSVKSSTMLMESNLAPSHYRCNTIRGPRSIIAAARIIDQHERTMHSKGFIKWLNIPVPNRIIMSCALESPSR